MSEPDTGARSAGPYRDIDLGDMSLPLWVIEFGADGTCLSPKTRELLVAEAAKPGCTDVFVFSHGWNNTFAKAVASYEKFVIGYHQFQRANGLSPPDPYRPLLIGLFWPSIDLALPRERAPGIAAIPAAGAETDLSLTDAVRDVTAALEPDGAARFCALAARSGLTDSEARELAGLLAEAYPADDEVDHEPAAPTADDIMATWLLLIEAGFTEDGGDMSGPDSFGIADEDRMPTARPETAGVISSIARFDPRDIVRAFTVYEMKDRAGVVGSAGGSALMCDLLGASGEPRFHLIGHSYGSRLLLSAVCANNLPRKVRSLLLLEPAVNYLCFARQVPKAGRPGGYRPALSRVDEPIMTTFSPNDKALHDFFHLAVRRHRDLGELKIAALGAVPSIYAALGGWGPGGLDDDEAKEIPLLRYPDSYPVGGVTCRVYALNGATGIGSHSDVINERTFWALYNQVAGPGATAWQS
jgi:pimeloyl-ACP methyl ester carboxylesterase